MNRATSNAKKADANRNDAPPPPPPKLKRVDTLADMERDVTAFEGAALVLIVTPLTSSTTNAVITALEQLNENRPPALAEMSLAVVYATPHTAAVCHHLNVSALPFVRSYAYGDAVAEFVGDSAQKIALLAKMAATQASEKAAALAAAAAATADATTAPIEA